MTDTSSDKNDGKNENKNEKLPKVKPTSSLVGLPPPSQNEPEDVKAMERRVLHAFEERIASLVEKAVTKLAVATLPPPAPATDKMVGKVDGQANKNGVLDKKVKKKKKGKKGKAPPASQVSLQALQQSLHLGQQDAKEQGDPPGDSSSDSEEESDEDDSVVPITPADKRGFANLNDQDLIASFAPVISEHGSVQSWCEKRTWNQGRTYREAFALSRMIDAMIKEGLDKSSRALGLAIRRLTGLQLADFYSDWSICDVVEQHSPGDTPLGLKQVTNILKQAQYLNKFSAHTEKKPEGAFQFRAKKIGGGKQEFGKQEQKQAPSAKSVGGAKDA